MGKRKPVSILKKRGPSALGAPSDASLKRQKAAGHASPGAQAPVVGSNRTSHWQPTSELHRQAAHAVGRLLHADATGRRGATLKSLTLAPHVTHKKALYAVTVETLKHVPVLRQLLEATQLLERHPRLSAAVGYVLVRDLLWGEGVRDTGPAEHAVLAAADALHAELAALLQRAGVREVGALLPSHRNAGGGRQRSARVNTLKTSVKEALAWLRAPPAEHADTWAAVGKNVQVDALLPELLLFPPGTALHNHPLVASGALILQSKASCLTAAALAPQPGWCVVDACAAPGNKTTHLAALLKCASSRSASSSTGAKDVIAFDKDPGRAQRLQRNVASAGAGPFVEVRCGDFLATDPLSPEFAGVKAVLLDPSCSGSGTAVSRMDHLLPLAAAAPTGAAAISHTDDRVEALATFQEAALRHALRFPSALRVAYSTCSLHERENEAVVAAVLPEAVQAGYCLVAALPTWSRRGVEGALSAQEAGKVVRTDPEEDGTDGFFVAVFEREAPPSPDAAAAKAPKSKAKRKKSAS